MNRIWSAIGKGAKDATFQRKAVKQFEKIEAGNIKVAAPKVPTEQKRFSEAQSNRKVREELARKYEHLIDNVNKITIKSSDPPTRPKSDKQFPTHESEYLHRNDPIWEYGFYEPPEEKIPKGKLMFREALEVLRLKQILEDTTGSTKAALQKQREQASDELKKMKAVSRVDPTLVEDMYEYFRPFVRQDTQKVVSKQELANLQDFLKGHKEERYITDGVKDHVREMIQNKIAREEYDRLEEAEKQNFQKAVKQLRAEEFERLEKRLGEINESEENFQKAVADAQEKKLSKEEEPPSDNIKNK